MASDQAYKRDLKRALSKLPLTLGTFRCVLGHLRVMITTEDQRSKELTCSGSPRDRDNSVNNVVRVAKHFIQGRIK